MVKKNIDLEVKKISKDAVLPKYYLPSDVGLDLVCIENQSLFPLEQKRIRTGLIIKIPKGYVGLIRDRAGIVSKMNVHTAAGTFDPDYRGELTVVLVNLGDVEVEIEKGMKIAQLLILPVEKVNVKQIETLDETPRGDKGFGSTGIKEDIEELLKLEKNIYKEG
ncbi:MAG: dUTP diphosphatase [Candidatus Pacearchaeota archaeon]